MSEPTSPSWPLVQYIDREGLVRGDRLPPERELASILSLSRGAVRTMLADLELNGKVWRHVGRGTFLGDRPTVERRDTTLSKINTFPAEVLETRLLIEPGLTGLAALRATPQEIDDIAQAAARGGDTRSFNEFEAWDSKFHTLVVQAARNCLASEMYRSVEAARSDQVWGKLKLALFDTNRKRQYEQSHRLISEAITNRDAEAAERHAREHLMEIRSSMLNR